jgi:hypothetical protein
MLFLRELTDTFRFLEGFSNELHEISPNSLPDSLSFPPPGDKTTADARHTEHKFPLLSFDPEFVPSIPRFITQSRASLMNIPLMRSSGTASCEKGKKFLLTYSIL